MVSVGVVEPGKDYIVFKLCVDECLNNPNTRVAYFFPTIKQGVAAVFEGITLDGKQWLDTLITTDMVNTPRSNNKLYHSDNTIRFKNGSIIRILGADKASTKVGTNEHIVVFSEASHMPLFKTLMNRMIPSVSQVNGRIVAISTPNYGSYFNEMMEKELDGWYKSIVKANEIYESDGSRVYTDDELAKNENNMSEAEFQQEYFCSLDMTNSSSIYGASFNKALLYSNLGRLGQHLYVSFDLGGNADYTVLTFARRGEDGILQVIHHLGINGVGSKFYSDYIQKYIEDNKLLKSDVLLLLPFDSVNTQRGYDSNTSTYIQLVGDGWKCQVVPRCGQADGINITREAIEHKKITFYNGDNNMKSYIKKIKSYEYKTNTDGSNTYQPNHGTAGDSPSNYADSLEYMCIYFFGKDYKNNKYQGFKVKENNYKNPYI